MLLIVALPTPSFDAMRPNSSFYRFVSFRFGTPNPHGRRAVRSTNSRQATTTTKQGLSLLFLRGGKDLRSDAKVDAVVELVVPDLAGSPRLALDPFLAGLVGR